ncbi:hypothetical protein EHS25_010094 [Saitozyma podzolica]|uniref:Uncharacterized protein n=1 Tax=Saitozyma podzolica TaxID=1890683 RepID=A0A427YIK6_9TREE|nr:hypothetical protein EHS25_010094 [Saitozyma podzolica]
MPTTSPDLHASLPPLVESPERERDSPTTSSSSSSFSSLFDSLRVSAGNRMDEQHGGQRRESSGSSTSWDSRADSSSRKGSGESLHFPEPRRPSATTWNSSDSERTVSEVQTPDQSADILRQYRPFNSSSPASSVTSSAPSKGEMTPRAELPQPVWPLTAASPRKSGKAKQTEGEGKGEGKGEGVGFATNPSLSEGGPVRSASLNRAGSWRRKHASY